MDKKTWETPVCNLCGSDKSKILWDKVIMWEYAGIFRIVQCIACGLAYVSPRPPQRSIGNFYPKEGYWGHDLTKKVTPNNWKNERTQAYGFLYNRILTLKTKGAIFDLGAGTGMFLTRFKELGWDTEGIELSKDAVVFAQKAYGIRLKCGDFLDFPFSSHRFDVVTLNNALEHLYDPKKTLQKVHNVLKDDGIVVVTVPNIKSLGAMIFGKHWYALQPPRHLYQFSPSTLSAMLSSLGFKTIEIQHNYRIHNYHSLFESFRMLFSPRFKKKSGGGLSEKKYQKRFSIFVEGGKIFATLFASVLAFFEPFLKRGEVITLYAKKNH